VSDITTMDSSAPAQAAELVPVLHVVFAAGEITIGDARRLRGDVLLGRSVGAGGISLEGDGQASREHARISAHGQRVSIEDLGSHNGIHVNARKVDRAELADGDVIRIGSTFAVLRYEDPHQVDVPIEALVGISVEMRAVRVAIKRLAKSDDIVLILGETGTGKELVARALHDVARREGAYVAVNCAAVQSALFEGQLFGHEAGAFTGAQAAAPGYFRAAKGGTLLLDEVGEMPMDLQPKMLRALETRGVVAVGATQAVAHGARVVAATHVGLETAVADGHFREDLYARLAQLTIEIPPLRQRREDLLLLLSSHLGKAPPLAPSLVEALLNHDWRRNVRELVAIVATLRTFQSAERLELDMVSDRLRESIAPKPENSKRDADTAQPTAAVEPEPVPVDALSLAELLRTHAGNVAKVARAIGRSRTQVYRLLESYQLDATKFRDG